MSTVQSESCAPTDVHCVEVREEVTDVTEEKAEKRRKRRKKRGVSTVQSESCAPTDVQCVAVCEGLTDVPTEVDEDRSTAVGVSLHESQVHHSSWEEGNVLGEEPSSPTDMEQILRLYQDYLDNVKGSLEGTRRWTSTVGDDDSQHSDSSTRDMFDDVGVAW
jgi:hypothetical protein